MRRRASADPMNPAPPVTSTDGAKGEASGSAAEEIGDHRASPRVRFGSFISGTPSASRSPAPSTAGERAVGQRPDYRCQQPGVFERQVSLVEVYQGVADDDRAAVSG